MRVEQELQLQHKPIQVSCVCCDKCATGDTDVDELRTMLWLDNIVLEDGEDVNEFLTVSEATPC
jgi:hypothetical protein